MSSRRSLERHLANVSFVCGTRRCAFGDARTFSSMPRWTTRPQSGSVHSRHSNFSPSAAAPDCPGAKRPRIRKRHFVADEDRVENYPTSNWQGDGKIVSVCLGAGRALGVRVCRPRDDLRLLIPAVLANHPDVEGFGCGPICGTKAASQSRNIECLKRQRRRSCVANTPKQM